MMMNIERLTVAIQQLHSVKSGVIFQILQYFRVFVSSYYSNGLKVVQIHPRALQSIVCSVAEKMYTTGFYVMVCNNKNLTQF